MTDAGDFTSPFDTSGGNGSGSSTGLAYDPVNHRFYGTSSFDGANTAGEVFSFDPATGAIMDVGCFNTPTSTTNGSGPTLYAANPSPGGAGARSADQ